MSDFEDYFSRHAGVYARHRPRYPAELFAYLARLSPARHLAWDCATGNGQAALALTEHFRQVIATDASEDQLAQAFPHPRIEYRRAAAEATDLASEAVDLVTVAVAVHWFDLERFYDEVRRVLKPNGVLAVWTYYTSIISPDLDRLIEHLTHGILGDCWPERIHYLRAGYRTLPFPFREVPPPAFETSAEWDLDELLGFITSWSASRIYLERHGRHAVEEIWPDLKRVWGVLEEKRHVRWPLHLRVGMKAARGRGGTVRSDETE